VHTHDHDHDHIQSHVQPNDHDGHGHSHLPPGADGTPVTWRSLLGLGISGCRPNLAEITTLLAVAPSLLALGWCFRFLDAFRCRAFSIELYHYRRYIVALRN
jgi:ABC-type nickel/cobalt efflux system permease component RcnA